MGGTGLSGIKVEEQQDTLSRVSVTSCSPKPLVERLWGRPRGFNEQKITDVHRGGGGGGDRQGAPRGCWANQSK